MVVEVDPRSEAAVGDTGEVHWWLGNAYHRFIVPAKNLVAGTVTVVVDMAQLASSDIERIETRHKIVTKYQKALLNFPAHWSSLSQLERQDMAVEMGMGLGTSHAATVAAPRILNRILRNRSSIDSAKTG